MKILRVSALIADRAVKERITEKQIHDELSHLMGISYAGFGHIRRATDPKRINLRHLVLMAEYFDCKIDDLINQAYLESRTLPNVAG